MLKEDTIDRFGRDPVTYHDLRQRTWLHLLMRKIKGIDRLSPEAMTCTERERETDRYMFMLWVQDFIRTSKSCCLFSPYFLRHADSLQRLSQASAVLRFCTFYMLDLGTSIIYSKCCNKLDYQSSRAPSSHHLVVQLTGTSIDNISRKMNVVHGMRFVCICVSSVYECVYVHTLLVKRRWE
jgi:hypothetical protein